MKAVTRLQAALLLGALALVAMQAGAAEAGGGCHSTEVTTGEGLTVEMHGNCFEPTVLTLEAGQSVTWTNLDGTPHMVTGAGQIWGSAEQIQKGEIFSNSFDEAGVYPYVCWLHPNMIGAVLVTEEGAAIPVADLMAAEPGASPLEPAAVEADADDGVPAVLAFGGVGMGLLVGFVGSTGWRRWRSRRG